MSFRHKRRLAVAVLVAAVAVLAAVGSATSGNLKSAATQAFNYPVDKGSDNFSLNPPSIAKYCGTKPWKLGLIDGFGGNSWRVEVRRLLEHEAKQCKTNTDVFYFNANLDPQKYISTLNAWTAQGVNVVVLYDDFGQAVVPAIRRAHKAGVKLGSDNAFPGDAVEGKDMTAIIIPSAVHIAEGVAAFFKKSLPGGKGGLVFLGGTPGNLLDPWMMKGLKEVLARPEYKGITLLQDTPAITNWDFGLAGQIATGLVNKYGSKLNGFVTSYVAMAPSVYRALKAAGKPLPAITGVSSSNETLCLIKSEGKDKFKVYSQDGTVLEALLALRKSLAAFQGIPNDEPSMVNLPTFIDTSSNMVPACQPKLPPGADLSIGAARQKLLPGFFAK